MQKNFSVVHKWASWPEIFQDADFMKRASPIIEDVADEFGDYIPEKTDIFAVSEPALITQLEVLL